MSRPAAPPCPACLPAWKSSMLGLVPTARSVPTANPWPYSRAKRSTPTSSSLRCGDRGDAERTCDRTSRGAWAGAHLCRVRRPDMDFGCRRAWEVMSARAPVATALRPQHGQAPCAPCAELQAEVCHTAACSHLLCTARMELELGDACRTQPALGHQSSGHCHVNRFYCSLLALPLD